MPIKYIFHISDIHIMEKNYVNITSSFRTLVNDIKTKGIDVSMLVIVGDIFESKSFLNTDDIYQWKSICVFLRNEKIKTLIIPGNHDYNINSELVRDNVSLLTGGYENIICENKTSIIDGSLFGDDRLSFYIFSPIDKLIPNVLPEDQNKIKIAMLHEPINYALYDNNEPITNARFEARDLDEFDYVMLGDIHLMQFLTPRIAYCGSFVQKTKGEGINKGYILWDLDIGKGVFHQLHLREVFLKIEANKNHCELPFLTKDQKVRHISLIYKDCSLSYLEDLKGSINIKYGYINRIVNNTKVNIIETPLEDVVESSTGYDHEQIIRGMLRDNENLPKILEHHNKMLLDRRENTYTTYKLNYLYWSNIFCYGEDNYINFNKFKSNLVMLNGKNKEGKSSIIDIIIRVLFNECERGFKDDIVNKSKPKGFIKISFNIGNDEYKIEQLYNRVSKNQQHRLYKNGTNITKDTVPHTYDYIRDVIGLGDYKDFVNMTTALQNRKFLVDMPQKDFIALLTKITNIDILKDVEDITKKELNNYKLLKRKVADKLDKLPVVNNEEIKLIQMKCKRLESTRDKLYDDIKKINKSLIIVNKNYNNIHIPSNLEEMMNNISNELNVFGELPYEIKDHKEIVEALWSVSKKLDTYPSNVLQNIMNTDYKSMIKDMNPDSITAQIKTLNDVSHKPVSNPRSIEVLNAIVNNPCRDMIMPLEKCEIITLNQLDPSHDKPGLIETGLKDYSQMKATILDLGIKIKSYNENYGALAFDDECQSCAVNKNSIKKIFDISHETETYKTMKQEYSQRNEIRTNFKNAVEYVKNNAQNHIFTSNQTIKLKNDAIIEVTKVYDAAVLELKEAHNKKKWDQMQMLEKQLNLFKEYDIQLYAIQKSKLVKAKKYTELLISFNDFSKLVSIQDNNGSKMAEIIKFDKLLIMASTQLETVNTKLSNELEVYRHKSHDHNTRVELEKEYESNSEALLFSELYFEIVNCKTGIPSHVLKNTCLMVQNNCNKILQTITDFSIYIEYDKDVKIYTIENDIKIPATMGSGMQKFILDLIFRITLTEISTISSPKTLFIDEGLGCLDKENFIAVANILQKLKSNFDSLIVISHISELQAYCDLSVNITRKDYLSNVQHGDLTIEQKTVLLMSEMALQGKTLTEYKDDVSKATAERKILKEDAAEAEITAYCNANGGMEVLMIMSQGARVYCNGCKKNFMAKKGFGEKHLKSATHKAKHVKYIQSLIKV